MFYYFEYSFRYLNENKNGSIGLNHSLYATDPATRLRRCIHLEGASFVGGVCLLGGKSSCFPPPSASALGDASGLVSGLAFKLMLARRELLRLDAGDRKSGVGDNRISLAPSAD